AGGRVRRRPRGDPGHLARAVAPLPRLHDLAERADRRLVGARDGHLDRRPGGRRRAGCRRPRPRGGRQRVGDQDGADRGSARAPARARLLRPRARPQRARARARGAAGGDVIVVRPLRDDEIDLYLAIRNRVHPQMPMPREHRRQGAGTALHRRASEHARMLGKARFYCVVRGDDADSLGYYGAHGYAEVGRMQDALLELEGFEAGPAELEIVPITAELERGVYEVAQEADADIPSGEPTESGSFEQWRERFLASALVLRDLSFAALLDGRPVGYAILGRHDAETAENWMTGVARSARGRGVALALKRHQAAAARAAGWRRLRAQNDLANAPMLRVNEKLGYERKFEWIHLTGPLLEG